MFIVKSSDGIKCYRVKIRVHYDTDQHYAENRCPLQIRNQANSSSGAVPVRRT